MRKQQKTSQKPYYVPLSIQKVFTYTIGILYSMQVGFVAWSTLAQSFDGSDYRPQLGYLFSYLLLPVVAFLAAYGLNPRKLSRISRAFESLLITIAAYIAWPIVMMFLPVFFLGSLYDSGYIFLDYLLPVTFILVFSLGLVALRQSKVWK